jgi:5'-3' exonuclease
MSTTGEFDVHLVDGTYELFRHFYALPHRRNALGEEVAAATGVVGSVLTLLADGATHVAVATDHVIESFRNELWPGYKDGSGIDPELRSQFGLLEEALVAAGIVVWAMTDFEADDALASGARVAANDPRVRRVLICTPDKDLAQCVRDGRVVQFDRRRRQLRDEAGVIDKFGVPPESIPDYLALVGDSADGFPGLRGWGAKSTSAVLARYGHLEDIPLDGSLWDVDVRGAVRLAQTFATDIEHALLFRVLATLVRDAPVSPEVDSLEWRGPRASFPATCNRLESRELVERARSAVRMRRT